jgi:hypothetical protein
VVNILFANFLKNPDEYRLSERYWLELWEQTDPVDRERFQWTYPWVGTGSPDILDGNPIFSACSLVLRRGIRVIQTEPVGPELDIHAWLDTFGGDVADPDRIDELVISCSLSDAASQFALSYMRPWMRGGSITFTYDEAGLPRGHAGTE